jgi:hypothetical protein
LPFGQGLPGIAGKPEGSPDAGEAAVLPGEKPGAKKPGKSGGINGGQAAGKALRGLKGSPGAEGAAAGVKQNGGEADSLKAREKTGGGSSVPTEVAAEARGGTAAAAQADAQAEAAAAARADAATEAEAAERGRELRDSQAPAEVLEGGGEGIPLAGAALGAFNYPGEGEASDSPEAGGAKAGGSAGNIKRSRLRLPFAGGADGDVPPPAGPEQDRTGGKTGEGEGRSADIRTRDRRRERLNPEVRDLRTAAGEEAAVAGTADIRPGPEAGPGGENRSGRIPETELPVELRSAGAKARGEVAGESENRAPESFHEILSRELHQNLNGDIVRHASILLRDGGEGLIRLSLKPESLGNVKIRLEMAENKIAGHIIVESDEALRAFEKEIRSLEQAFRDSGFDGANLEMSLAGDGGQYDDGRRAFFEEPSAFRLAAAAYDTVEVPLREITLGGNPYGRDQGRIDMLV